MCPERKAKMAKQVKIKWNHKGFEQVLCSPGAKAMLGDIAQRTADIANTGYLAQIAESASSGEGVDVSYKNIAKGKFGFEAKKPSTAYMFGSNRAIAQVVSMDKEAAAAESEHKVLSMAVMLSGV